MNRPATVLVADDDPDIRSLIELAVQRAGHTVLASVADGEQALSAAAQYRPDLVILDVSMPKVTGLQVCAQLRAEHSGAEHSGAEHSSAAVKILILSADVQDSAVRAGMDAGADAYLAKPFTLRTLRGQRAALLAGPAL